MKALYVGMEITDHLATLINAACASLNVDEEKLVVLALESYLDKIGAPANQ